MRLLLIMDIVLLAFFPLELLGKGARLESRQFDPEPIDATRQLQTSFLPKIHNNSDYKFTTTVYVGKNFQKMNLTIDTGSSLTWLQGVGCANWFSLTEYTSCPGSAFISKDSNTFKGSSIIDLLSYSSFQIQGYVSQDYFTFFKYIDQPIQIAKNISFILAMNVKR